MCLYQIWICMQSELASYITKHFNEPLNWRNSFTKINLRLAAFSMTWKSKRMLMRVVLESENLFSSQMSTFQRLSSIYCHVHPSFPDSLSLSVAYSSLHVAISSAHHHYWGPFVWRSYLSSSPAWTHPLASSSRMTPSCRWPGRWNGGRERDKKTGWDEVGQRQRSRGFNPVGMH